MLPYILSATFSIYFLNVHVIKSKSNIKPVLYLFRTSITIDSNWNTMLSQFKTAKCDRYYCSYNSLFEYLLNQNL